LRPAGRAAHARVMWRRRSRRDRSLAVRVIIVAGSVGALSTALPWFSYSWVNSADTVTSSLVGLHDVTGRTMFFAGVAEAVFAVGYLFVRPGIARRLLRGAMVLLAFYMITVPLAAMAHSGAVPGSPAVDPPAGVFQVEATGAIGVVIALIAAVVVLGASWLTVLDSVGEAVPARRSPRS
jgi:hypothetical protein